MAADQRGLAGLHPVSVQTENEFQPALTGQPGVMGRLKEQRLLISVHQLVTDLHSKDDLGGDPVSKPWQTKNAITNG